MNIKYFRLGIKNVMDIFNGFKMVNFDNDFIKNAIVELKNFASDEIKKETDKNRLFFLHGIKYQCDKILLGL